MLSCPIGAVDVCNCRRFVIGYANNVNRFISLVHLNRMRNRSVDFVRRMNRSLLAKYVSTILFIYLYLFIRKH